MCRLSAENALREAGKQGHARFKRRFVDNEVGRMVHGGDVAGGGLGVELPEAVGDLASAGGDCLLWVDVDVTPR